MPCLPPVLLPAWPALPRPQAEITALQGEMAEKRRGLEALEADLKEFKERVAANKDAGVWMHAGVAGVGCEGMALAVVLVGWPKERVAANKDAGVWTRVAGVVGVVVVGVDGRGVRLVWLTSCVVVVSLVTALRPPPPPPPRLS